MQYYILDGILEQKTELRQKLKKSETKEDQARETSFRVLVGWIFIISNHV